MQQTTSADNALRSKMRKKTIPRKIQWYEQELKRHDLEAASFAREDRLRYESLRNDFVAQTLAWLHWIDASPLEVTASIEEAYYEFKTSWYELITHRKRATEPKPHDTLGQTLN